MTLTYEFGAATSTSQTKAGPRIKESANYVGYTSTAAPISISLNVTPVGGATSNYTGSCTAVAAGTAGTCTVTFTASPGPTIFSGTLSESGNIISSFGQITIVAPSSLGTLSFTSNPVVQSVVLQLATNSVNAGTSSSTLLTVNAEDANGKIIAGTAPYVDSNGNPLALLLNVTNTQAGGKGTVSIQGPLRITAPGQAPIYAHYDGNWLKQATISVSSTSKTLASFTNATLSTLPGLGNSFTIPTANAKPRGFIAGPDGNFWFTEYNSDQVGRMTPSGTFTEWAVPTPNASPFELTNGPDGNIWFTEKSVSKLASITTTGTVTEHTLPGSLPAWITLGPDALFWIAENPASGNIVASTTNGISTLYNNGSDPNGLTAGPDGNIWYTDFTNNKIARITLSGVLTEFNTPTATSGPSNITTGPDGNLWFTEYSSGKIGRITTSGTITEYSLSSGTSEPYDITQGPDGNLWFTEYSSGNIGFITTSGSVTEYSLSNSAAGPMDIVVGPDNNLWFNGYHSNIIYQFVY